MWDCVKSGKFTSNAPLKEPYLAINFQFFLRLPLRAFLQYLPQIGVLNQIYHPRCVVYSTGSQLYSLGWYLVQNISCVNLLFRFPRSRSLNSYFKDLAQRKRWKVFYCQNFTESFSDLRRGKISHHMSSGLTSPRLRLLILKYFHKMVSPHLIQKIFVQWQNKQTLTFFIGVWSLGNVLN